MGLQCILLVIYALACYMKLWLSGHQEEILTGKKKSANDSLGTVMFIYITVTLSKVTLFRT